MIDSILSIFEYDFMLRALVTGVALCACASVIGVSLVLKHYSMMGDGLSHVGFGSLCFAVVLNASPLYVSIPIVLTCAFLLLNLPAKTKIQKDSIIAVMSTAALASGVMIISVTEGINTDICNYLFGSILSLTDEDMYICVIASVLILLVFFMFFRNFFSVGFDMTFAKVQGINVKFFNTILALMSALIIVLGMKMMGALLISNIIVVPAICAMMIFKSYKAVVFHSLIASMLCFLIGLVLSFELSTPTGASIVLINMLSLLIHFLLKLLLNR